MLAAERRPIAPTPRASACSALASVAPMVPTALRSAIMGRMGGPLYNPRPRRWFRFSLRSLFLLTIVAGLLLWTVNKAREQGIAVAALKGMGCTFSYGNPDPGGAPYPLTHLERLRKLLGEDEPRSVTKVIGFKSQITDAGLVRLQGMTQLQWLELQYTQVTDAGLVHLERLTRLSCLNLYGTHITDDGLVHLRGLAQLQSLGLGGTQVTDAGLAHLRGLTRLVILYLHNTQVTDAGLVHLGGLTQLRQLKLVGTDVTDAGVQRLQKVLPKCNIW